MSKLTKDQLIEKAELLQIDISAATNNVQREDFINAEILRRESIQEDGKKEGSDEKEIVEATDNEIEKETIQSQPVDGKVYSIDLALKGDDEPMEDFIARAELQKLGEWITFEEPTKDGRQATNDIDVDEEEVKAPTNIDLIYLMRLDLDMAMQYIANTFGERSESYKSIFTAKAWLGKTLGHLGKTNPYIAKDPIKAPSDIPPTADVFDNPKLVHDFNLKSNLDRVIILREILDEIIDVVNDIKLTEEEADAIEDVRLFAISLTQCYVNMCEARFELGYRLSRIKQGQI